MAPPTGRSLRTALAFGALWLVAGPAAAGRASLALAQKHLALDLRLDYASRTVVGGARLTFENISDAPVAEVPLNLNRLMRVRSVADASGRAIGFRQAVVVFDDDAFLQVDHAVIALPKPLPIGERVTIAVDYAGPLVGYAETGSLYIRDVVDEAFTILRRDAYAFPVLEETSWGINRAAAPDAFTFDARVTVPERLTVATGGRLVDHTASGGLATWHYASDATVPFVNIAIAPYEILESGPLRVYHFPQDAAGARRVAAQAEKAIGRLTEWFGPLPREPRITVIEIPEGWGSQADLVAGIIQTAAAFREAGALQELYHELSHLWNAPDNDLPSPRWNEGLGRYLQRRLAGDLDAWSGIASDAESTALRLVEQARRDPTLAQVPFERYGAAHATDHSYRVGFLFFCGLERLMGREALDRGLRSYYQDHRSSGGTTRQLEAALQAATARDLAPFFRDWLHGTRWIGELSEGRSFADVMAGYEAAGPRPR